MSSGACAARQEGTPRSKISERKSIVTAHEPAIDAVHVLIIRVPRHMLVVVMKRSARDPRLIFDVVCNEPHRAVAERKVGAARVQAGKSYKATWRTGRIPGNRRVRIVEFGVRSSGNHAEPGGPRARRIPHSDPRRRI